MTGSADVLVGPSMIAGSCQGHDLRVIVILLHLLVLWQGRDEPVPTGLSLSLDLPKHRPGTMYRPWYYLIIAGMLQDV